MSDKHLMRCGWGRVIIRGHQLAQLFASKEDRSNDDRQDIADMCGRALYRATGSKAKVRIIIEVDEGPTT